MRKSTVAALFAGLVLLPLASNADTILYDQAGRAVAVLVPVTEASAPRDMPADPFAALFAQQDAMLRRMMAQMQDMQAASTRRDPAGALEAAFGGIPGGSSVVVSSFSSGEGSCSQTVTYNYRGGAAPVVQVRQSGDACGALPRQGTVPAALPPGDPATRSPDVVPAPRNGPKLIEADYHAKAKPSPVHRF